jgi:hypothetical protein
MHGVALSMELNIKACFVDKTFLRSFSQFISDNDDDGETAAGGRLAHLLQIMVHVSFCLHFSVVHYEYLAGSR